MGPVTVRCNTSPVLYEHHASDAVRRIRRRTRAAYRCAFGASIEPVFDRYLELVLPTGTLTLGFAPGPQPFFLEQYLDQPLEQVLATVAHRPVNRARIVELGHLVGDSEEALRHLVPALARWTERRSAHFVAIALTAGIAQRLAALGVRLDYLGPARADRVAHPGCWGSYYRHDPAVYAVDLVQRRREQRP